MINKLSFKLIFIKWLDTNKGKKYFKEFKIELKNEIINKLIDESENYKIISSLSNRSNILKFLSYNITKFIIEKESIKNFINKQNYVLIKSINRIISPFDINFWLQIGLTENETMFKIYSLSKYRIEYWLYYGYNNEESIKKISEIQKNNSNKYIKKRKLNPEKYNDIAKNQIKYWLKNGYSVDESKLKVKERQSTFTLVKCIKKYGKTEGTKIFNERQNKWQYTLKNKSKEEIERINKLKGQTIENFIKKGYTLKEAQELKKSFVLKTIPKKSYSKESITILNVLYNKLLKYGINIIDIYWKDKEYYIYKNNRYYFYDFTIKSKKIIIEYNGSKFHPSPKLNLNEQKNWKQLWSNKSYDVVKKLDEYKIQTAKDNNFDVFIIWDYFTKIEIENVFNKIIELLI